jgi:hypothetical protein
LLQTAANFQKFFGSFLLLPRCPTERDSGAPGLGRAENFNAKNAKNGKAVSNQ